MGAPAWAPVFELAVAVFLILLNGVFALSEFSIVSSRKSRLKALADSGAAGARTALHLSENPGKFLSTVQIGITLVGILAGAFSGAALGARLTEILLSQGMQFWLAETVGYGGVISIITYLSVVVGELVPKQFALRNAEGIACRTAPAMKILSQICAPAVWLLNASTSAIFRFLGQSTASESLVTEEEIKSLVSEAEAAGVIEGHEKEMISGVLRLSDRLARSLMTPRGDVDWINIQDSDEAIRATLIASPHSRLPVTDGGSEHMIGVVQSRELLAAALAGNAFDLRAVLRSAPIVPETLDALGLLDVLRKAEVPMALVHDEYGHFEGVVTPADVLEAIAGAFRSDMYGDDEKAVQRDEGSWLLAGSMPVDEMAERLGVALAAKRDYETVAGLFLHGLRHLPRTGETLEKFGWRFEVVDMDGNRIDKILAIRLSEAN